MLSGEALIGAFSALGAGGFVDLVVNLKQEFFGTPAPLAHASFL